MDTAELLKKVRKIEIKTKGLSLHQFSGEYHSAFKGRGMSFSEVRDYQYGDDVRNIDWNVTARTGRPHVKIFEEEREMTVMLLADLSGSSYFGTRQQLKNELKTELSAVLAFSAINNNDKVGILFFTDRIEKFIPPKKGRQHILRIIRELLDFKPVGRRTDIAEALRYFNNVVKKRSICFILSDFMAAPYERALKIVARKHDVVGIHLYDPREVEIPNVGLLRTIDPESGTTAWLDTASPDIRESITNRFEQNFQYFKNTFKKSGADQLSLRTDASYPAALHRFFKKRTMA